MAVVRQANWHKIGGESPLKRKDEPSTFLREPCVGAREGVGEASVAVRMGRLLSIESSLIGSAEAVIAVEGNTGWTVTVRGSRAPRCQRTHARTYVLCRDLGGLVLSPARAGASWEKP